MKPFEKPVFVTRPFLPPISDFCDGLEEIWDNKLLTNNGPLVQRLEKKLADFMGTKNITLFTNGTLALQLGLQGLDLSGEVITTPFSFVATTHVLYWNKLKPVFCDIEPNWFTIDPDRIEALINPWTTAILAVHVFGYPCHVEKLEKIAKKNKLMLIYDAAHAFGVRIDGKTIAHFGDLSMFSFHATKFFHTLEGGMLVFQKEMLKTKFNYLKNFGFKNETEVLMPGTNAKMNEMQALMGLLLLDYVDKMIEKRRKIFFAYRECLSNLPGICFSPELNALVHYNYAYVPIQIHADEFGMGRDDLYQSLKRFNIYARRYFYPLIPDFVPYRALSNSDPLLTARGVSERILTLPIYDDLSVDDVYRLCEIIAYIQKGKKVF